MKAKTKKQLLLDVEALQKQAELYKRDIGQLQAELAAEKAKASKARKSMAAKPAPPATVIKERPVYREKVVTRTVQARHSGDAAKIAELQAKIDLLQRELEAK